MNTDFTSYAYQELPRKKIKKYAEQYAGVDMAQLLGADEDNFPFIVRAEDDQYQVMIWNTYNGFMEHTDEDPVCYYATVEYLRDHAYPIFDSMAAAEKWSRDHHWPRKTKNG